MSYVQRLTGIAATLLGLGLGLAVHPHPASPSWPAAKSKTNSFYPNDPWFPRPGRRLMIMGDKCHI
jgi:hypothetical protein